MAHVQTIAQPVGLSSRSQVLRLALPAVGEQVLNTLVGLADVYLVGNLTLQAAEQLGYGSVVAINSVGLSNQMIWLVTVLFMAVGVGSTALIARATGAGEQQNVQRFLQQSLLIALGVGGWERCWSGCWESPFCRCSARKQRCYPTGWRIYK